MDRTIVYPGSIPMDTDILRMNLNVMVGLGYLAQAVFGTRTVIDGLRCTPALSSMGVSIAPGSITSFGVTDAGPYGSIGADSTPLLRMGISPSSTFMATPAPTSSGQSVAYVVQATFQETDVDPLVLTYYNVADPTQPFAGPNNSNNQQFTSRSQSVHLMVKAGAPATTGTQVAPPVDSSWIGLYTITVAYGQTQVDSSAIVAFPTAPFVYNKLQDVRPGFGLGCQSFASSGAFTVPAGINQLEVEVWGGGSGSFASTVASASGGGSGGGYARKRVTGLTPGQSIPVTVGSGGRAGLTDGTAPTAGGISSFGNFVSATGGALNYLATTAAPQNGGTPAGTGQGGDVNLIGSAGHASILNQGGMGGGAPMGGAQNSGTTGVNGTFPGGGASGAGTGANSATAYNGASGGGGLVVVRW